MKPLTNEEEGYLRIRESKRKGASAYSFIDLFLKHGPGVRPGLALEVVISLQEQRFRDYAIKVLIDPAQPTFDYGGWLADLLARKAATDQAQPPSSSVSTQKWQ
jgi:hypothetical protein